jgi:hypothetical protein
VTLKNLDSGGQPLHLVWVTQACSTERGGLMHSGSSMGLKLSNSTGSHDTNRKKGLAVMSYLAPEFPALFVYLVFLV